MNKENITEEQELYIYQLNKSLDYKFEKESVDKIINVYLTRGHTPFDIREELPNLNTTDLKDILMRLGKDLMITYTANTCTLHFLTELDVLIARADINRLVRSSYK